MHAQILFGWDLYSLGDCLGLQLFRNFLVHLWLSWWVLTFYWMIHIVLSNHLFIFQEEFNLKSQGNPALSEVTDRKWTSHRAMLKPIRNLMKCPNHWILFSESLDQVTSKRERGEEEGERGTVCVWGGGRVWERACGSSSFPSGIRYLVSTPDKSFCFNNHHSRNMASLIINLTQLENLSKKWFTAGVPFQHQARAWGHYLLVVSS